MNRRIKPLTAFLILLMTGTASARSDASEIIDWAQNSGHTYYLLGPSTWEQAEADAIRLGGHLVTIDDADENEFVLIRFGSPAINDANGSGTVSLWIGLNDSATEGNFVWAGGSSSFFNWDTGSGQPEGAQADEDFVGMFADGASAGLWHDIVADGRLGDVCYGVVEIDSLQELTVPPPPGIIAWWPGENTAWDVVGPAGGSMKNASNLGQGAYAPGKVGSAFAFDGVDDHVLVPDHPSHHVAKLTVEAWVSFTSLDTSGAGLPGRQYIVFKKNGTASNTAFFEGFALMKTRTPEGDRFAFITTTTSGTEASAVSTTLIQTGVFYHVAGTFDGSATRLYVNGLLESTIPHSEPLELGNGPLIFGQTGLAFDGKFHGKLDELTLYDRALSDAEIDMIDWVGKGGKDRHDPARDFSETSNPNQPWSFGSLPQGDLNPANLSLFPGPAYDDGSIMRSYAPTNGGLPNLAINTSASDPFGTIGAGGTPIYFNPRQMSLHPSPDGHSGAMQWQAPEAGRYAVSATFYGLDTKPTSTSVFIRHNDKAVFPVAPESNYVNSFLGDGISVTREVSMHQDDLLAWIVDYAGDFSFETTGLVASVVLLESFGRIENPSWQDPITTANPPMTGRNWRFHGRNESAPDHPGMTAKVQYSATPNDPDSWIDLPGGGMTRQGDLRFLLDISTLPVGSFAFRIATSVDGVGTTFSEPSQVYDILDAAPFLETEIDVKSASDPTGATTHRGDLLTYTMRFRNSGAAGVGAMRARIRFPDNTMTSFPAHVEVVPYVENLAGTHSLTSPGGSKVAAGDHFVWEWPVNAVRPVGEVQTGQIKSFFGKNKQFLRTEFTVPNNPNHGYENGDIVRLSPLDGQQLVSDLSANTDYRVVDATRTTFRLVIDISRAPYVSLANLKAAKSLRITRVSEWQSRKVTFKLFDPTPQQEQAQATAGLPPINAEGGTLVSNAKLLEGSAGSTVVASRNSAVTTLVNPLRLTVERVGSGPVAQGGIVVFDILAKNESSLRTNRTQITVNVPNGLAILAGGSHPVFLGPDGQPSGPPIDHTTGHQVVRPASWASNPRLLEVEIPSGVIGGTPGYEQQAQFYFGGLNPGASQEVRITCRVQYDWVTASDPVITFENGRVSGLLGVADRSREAENSIDLNIMAAAPGSPRPELSVWVEQEANGVIPTDASIVAVAKVQGLSNLPYIVDEDNIRRGINEIVYRVTYENSGAARAEHVRVWVPVPEGTDYVQTTILERVPPYKKRVKRNGRWISVPVKNYRPKTVVSGRLLQAGDDLGVVPTISLVGENRWLTCLLPYLEASGVAGSEKTLEFRVKLKNDVEIGDRVEQTGALLTSRELFYWTHSAYESPEPGYSPYLLAEAAPPGHLNHWYDQFQTISTDGSGNPNGQTQVVHRIIYENSSPIQVTEAGIRFTIPPGYSYSHARLVDADGDVGSQLGITTPRSDEVLFDLGTVAGTSVGIAEIVLSSDLGNFPDETSQPNPLYRNQTPGKVVIFDSLHPEEPSFPLPKSTHNKNLDASEAFLSDVLTMGLPANKARVWSGVISPPPAKAGEEVTYRILVGNNSPFPTEDTGAVNFFVRLPPGTTYVRSQASVEFRGNLIVLDSSFAPDTGLPHDYGIVNPVGIVAHSVNLQGHGFVAFDFTVLVEEGRERDLWMLGPVFVPGDKVGSVTAPRTVTAIIKDSDTEEQIREKVSQAQFAAARARAFGTANQNEPAFQDARNEISESSASIVIGGADVVTVPGHNLVLIPMGGGYMVAAGAGNLIGNDGGSIQGNGAAIVAAGAGNIVAAGAGNLISFLVPQNGQLQRMAGSDYFAQLPQMVAAGAGNIVAAGGLNLVRYNDFEVNLTNGAGKLIGMDGGSLIGLDGGSLGTIVQSLETGETSIRLPGLGASAVQVALQQAGMVAAGAGNLVGNNGNSLVGNSGNTIYFTGGGRILAANSVNLIRSAEMVAAGAGNMVAAGGGNVLPSGAGRVLPSGAGRMVAAGAGNIVAAGAGNIISINNGMVAAGAGN